MPDHVEELVAVINGEIGHVSSTEDLSTPADDEQTEPGTEADCAEPGPS